MPDQNGSLHTEHWGSADTAVARAVLLPGITSSAATMWELGEGLADAGWAAVAVDLPGHGGSALVASYRFADIADLIAAQLGPGWDLVIGHSLGGAIATVLFAAHPGFATRALLIDPALLVSDDVAAGLAVHLQRDQAGQTEADVAAASPRWHPRTVAERVRSTMSADVSAVAGYAAHNRPWDVREQAAQVGVAVHVLVPTDHPTITDAVTAELSAATRPRWRFETVADTTHSVHRDNPALVVDRALRPAADG